MNYTITIGIPAHNEQKNIKRLILSLLSQITPDCQIVNILIASDASSDNTNNIVQSLAKINKKIKLLSSEQRIGKANRINEIFRYSKTDFVVVFDADINIKSNKTVYNLIKPMILNKDIMLTSGISQPKVPVNFAQKIAMSGFSFWDSARKFTKNSDLYFCEGPTRAFRNKLYKKLRFPATIAEDVFPYLYCMKFGYKFQKVYDSTVFYTLPSSISEYRKQMTRAISTVDAQQKHFDKAFLDKYYVIKTKEKLKSIIYQFIREPFFTILFLLTVSFPKILNIIRKNDDNGVWNILSTTKANG